MSQVDINAARQAVDHEIATLFREAEKLIAKDEGWKMHRVESDENERKLFFRRRNKKQWEETFITNKLK